MIVVSTTYLIKKKRGQRLGKKQIWISPSFKTKDNEIQFVRHQNSVSSNLSLHENGAVTTYHPLRRVFNKHCTMHIFVLVFFFCLVSPLQCTPERERLSMRVWSLWPQGLGFIQLSQYLSPTVCCPVQVLLLKSSFESKKWDVSYVCVYISVAICTALLCKSLYFTRCSSVFPTTGFVMELGY